MSFLYFEKEESFLLTEVAFRLILVQINDDIAEFRNDLSHQKGMPASVPTGPLPTIW